MMFRYAHITGWGMHVPEKVLTNGDIAKMVNTSDEWIQERTGIRERHVVMREQTTASLGTEACLMALKAAGIGPTKVDLIIVATSSPEHLFPTTASLIQDSIGAVNAGAFDLLAACTGFIYAMDVAAQAIRSGSINTALVIGSETLSRFVNWKDRGTSILFGDGAGALVLQGSDQPGGILSSVLKSDGSGADLLHIPAGGSSIPASPESVSNGQHYIHMNGREVFRFATRVMAQVTEEAVKKANLKMEDVDLIIPHQANYRIIEAAARQMKLPIEKFMVNVDRYGNTSAASIPIATCEALQANRLGQGNKVVFVGFGAGLTWGALVVDWTGTFPHVQKVRTVRYYRARARIWSILRRLGRRIESLIWGGRYPGF
jgi:3-oxoacyl-[acyl-carrier-protein] synthase-3